MRRLCVIGAVLAASLVADAQPAPCTTALTFAPGRSALTSTTKHALEPALAQLRSHPQLHVTIVAPDARDPLAKRRSDVVKWFLVDGGIEVDRIEMATGAGSGMQLQLAGCTASLTQTVATTLAPARPATAVTAPAHSGSIVDDASDLANLLAGDKPAASRAEIERPLTTSRGPALTIGNDSVGFRGEDSVRANTGGGGLRLASATLVQSASPRREESVARTTLSTGPTLAAIQPEGQPVKLDGRQLRALSRCYRKVPGLQPGDRGDVELTFVVDKLGRVKEPVVVTDEDELIGCIGNVMKNWDFPELKKSKSRIWVSVVLTAG